MTLNFVGMASNGNTSRLRRYNNHHPPPPESLMVKKTRKMDKHKSPPSWGDLGKTHQNCQQRIQPEVCD